MIYLSTDRLCHSFNTAELVDTSQCSVSHDKTMAAVTWMFSRGGRSLARVSKGLVIIQRHMYSNNVHPRLNSSVVSTGVQYRETVASVKGLYRSVEVGFACTNRLALSNVSQ